MTKGQLGLLIAAVLIVSCTGSEPPPSSTPSLSPWPTPSPTRLPLPTSADLSAPTDTVVWAEVGGRLLYVSSDRGVTWKQRFLPPPGSFPLPEISFVSESEGWLLSTTVLTAQCEGQSVVLWHSTDGAHTWQAASATGISQQRCKSSVSFADAHRGFLAAWNLADQPIIYRTNDGGATWGPSIPLPDPPGFATKPGGFTLHPGRVTTYGATLLVAATGVSFPAVGTPPVYPARTYVYRSSDGGASWSFSATAPDGGDPVAFVSPTRWLQLKGPGHADETLDGGVTWHTFSSEYTQATPQAPYVTFASDTVGYATVQGTLERTLDGGAHWIPMPMPGT
jgi:photosystem II stability/assembly factor-like uncharacterized protein